MRNLISQRLAFSTMSSEVEKIASIDKILTADVFSDIIESKIAKKNLVTDLNLTAISGTGDNYSSVIYRAKVSAKVQDSDEGLNFNFIVKASLPKEWNEDNREILIYKNLLPEFEKIWTKFNEKSLDLTAKCFKVIEQPRRIIVLEDLSADHYVIPDRKLGMNVEQAKLALRKIARLHAVSAVYYQRHGPFHPILETSGINTKLPPDHPLVKTNALVFNYFCDTIRFFNIQDPCHEKFTKWNGLDLMASYWKTVVPMKCGFKVLCHNDSWITNIMLKSVDGNFLDAKLIDFEMSLWKSPVGDLITFIFTSVADEFKVSRFDELIEFYHGNLVEYLRIMEYSEHIPTLEELVEDLYENRVLALVCLTSHLIFCKYNSQIPFSAEVFYDGSLNDESMERMFRNEVYGRTIKILLPLMEKKGWLDKWTAD